MANNPNGPPAVEAPTGTPPALSGNALRKAQRQSRPARGMLPTMVLKAYGPKVERRPGTKCAAEVVGLYVPGNIGQTVGALITANPLWRPHILWDYQHGYITVE